MGSCVSIQTETSSCKIFLFYFYLLILFFTAEKRQKGRSSGDPFYIDLNTNFPITSYHTHGNNTTCTGEDGCYDVDCGDCCDCTGCDIGCFCF